MFSQGCPAGGSPAVVPATPDPAQVAGAVDRYMALREFRARLYGCLTARADALFELCDAVLCARAKPEKPVPSAGTPAGWGDGFG